MKLHHQLITNHNPDEGVYGDCHRTALACMLDKHPSDLPNFADTETWRERTEHYLETQGLASFSFPYQGDLGVDRVLECIAHNNPNIEYMLCGTAAAGVNHVVVCKGNKIIHDPHPRSSGLTGPCDDGFFWVTLLVPARFNERTYHD